MNIGNIIYYNYGENYEDIVDHGSCIHNLRGLGFESRSCLNFFQA